MLTVITETVVHKGRESDWDEAYHERAADARKQDGWVDLHLLVRWTTTADVSSSVPGGTATPGSAGTRRRPSGRTRGRLDAATAEHGEDRWFEVVEDKASETSA